MAVLYAVILLCIKKNNMRDFNTGVWLHYIFKLLQQNDGHFGEATPYPETF